MLGMPAKELKLKITHWPVLICIFIVLFAMLSSTAAALTYTKNSFPTYSGFVIRCDGSDTKISCQDSGNGRNHWCNSYGTNGCQAFEGSDNYGSPGCLITCERQEIQRCTDGTAYGFCSANVPFFCDNGNLIKRASFCGCQAPLKISGDDCVSPTAVCSDGTLTGKCSATKPLFCSDGTLVNRASTCGCPSGQVAVGNDCITPSLVCSDGTSSGQCSTNKPLFCLNGNLVNKASICGCSSGQIVSGDNCTSITQLQISAVSGKLVIADVDAEIDGKKSSNIQDNGKIGKDAKPGSNVELIITIKNDFSTSDGVKIEDIQVSAKIEDIGDGDGIEDVSDSFDLRANNDKKITLKLKVPLNVEEGTYNIAIETEGEDENGNEHEDSFDVELEVKKESHDLRFLSLDLSPKSISCNRELTVNLKAINLGKEDDGNAVLELSSDIPDFGFVRQAFPLASGTKALSSSIKFKINGKVEKGLYNIIASINSDDGVVRDKQSIAVSVEDCKETLKDEEVVLIMPEIKEKPAILPTKKLPKLFSLKGMDLTALMLILALLLLVLLILAMAVVAERRRKKYETEVTKREEHEKAADYYPYYGKVEPIKHEIKEERKEELKQEIKEEIRRELEEETKKAPVIKKEELVQELRQELKEEVKKEIEKAEIKEEPVKKEIVVKTKRLVAKRKKAVPKRKKAVIKRVRVPKAKVIRKKIRVPPFVASTEAKGYHTIKCGWAKIMKRKNKVYFSTRKRAEAKGFKPHECVTKGIIKKVKVPKFITKKVKIPARIVTRKVKVPARTITKKVSVPEKFIIKKVRIPEKIVIRKVRVPKKFIIKKVKVPKFITKKVKIPARLITRKVKVPARTITKRVRVSKAKVITKKVRIPARIVTKKVKVPARIITKKS